MGQNRSTDRPHDLRKCSESTGAVALNRNGRLGICAGEKAFIWHEQALEKVIKKTNRRKHWADRTVFDSLSKFSKITQRQFPSQATLWLKVYLVALATLLPLQSWWHESTWSQVYRIIAGVLALMDTGIFTQVQCWRPWQVRWTMPWRTALFPTRYELYTSTLILRGGYWLAMSSGVPGRAVARLPAARISS